MNAGVVRGEWTSCSQLNWHINKYARGHLMNLLCDDGIMSEEASVYSFVFATCSYHIFMHSTSMIQTMPSKGNLDTIQSTWWRACTRFRPHHTTCCLHLARSVVRCVYINWQNCRNYNHFHPLPICELHDLFLSFFHSLLLTYFPSTKFSHSHT